MNQTTIGVNITPQSLQPTLHFSQGDVGRVFVVNVTDYDIPTDATVTCVATKPSGMGFTVSGTVSGNSVTFTSTAEMTDEWGRFPAEIRIASGNTLLGTANFLMVGEKDPHPTSTIDGTQEELIPQLTLLVNRVEAAAESVHDLTVSATTLAAGSDATATYDSANNSIAFGIPRGADGDVTRSEFNDLKSDLDDSGIAESVSYETVTGVIRASDGGVIGELPNAHSSDIQLYAGDKLIVTAYTYAQFAILAEVVDGTYTSIIAATTNGVKTTEYTAQRDIVVSFSLMANAEHNAKIIRSLATTQEKLRAGLADKVGFIVDDLRNGTIENLANADAVSMINIRPTNGAYGARVFIKRQPSTDAKYMARYTTFSVSSGNARNNMSNNIKYNYDSEKGISFVDILFDSADTGFCFFLLQQDSSGNRVPLRVDDFDANDIFVCYLYKDSAKFINYCIGPDFCKKPITLEYQGTLSGWQSFCMYDSNIYSATADGSLIKQNSRYTQLSAKQLDIGHANSFQLGSNGKAYISGWDDNKVYVIDIASMEVESTITLPTTGYTGCAIDDVNKIAYIFQRDTYPSTKEHYNFIVYDYFNQQIIETKKTNVAFGAMQACDFIDGKIFVLNGSGSTTIPNGYRIYNTNGDVMGEYVIGSYSTLEPEGVFVNRETKEIYISYGNGRVYKIS